MTPEQEKENRLAAKYATLILTAVEKMFEDDELSIQDLMEGDNLTHFMHALGNQVPCHMYYLLTKKQISILDFNHLANKLCFQYGNIAD